MFKKGLGMVVLLLLTECLFLGRCRAESFDLAQIKQYAREHSPRLQAKASEIGIQQGEQTTTRASLLPSLSLGGGYTRYRLDHGALEGVSGADQVADNERYFGGVTFNFIAFSFGKNYFAYRGASSLVSSREKDYTREWQTVVFDLSTLYYLILTVDKTTVATEKTIESLKVLHEEIKKKVEVERLPEVDLLKVEVSLSRAVDDLSKLKTLRVRLLGDLRRLMGYEEEKNLEVLAQPIEEIIPEPFNIPELLTKAYETRDDLKSLEDTVKSVEYQIKSVKASYFPRVDLQATYIEQAPGSGDFKSDAAAGVVLTMPLFDGLARKGTTDSLVAEKFRLKSLMRDKKLDIQKELKTATTNYQESLVRVDTTGRSVAHAQEVLRIEKLRYNLGRTPINFVLEAEGALLSAQSLFYRAYYDNLIALESVQLAVGELR